MQNNKNSAHGQYKVRFQPLHVSPASAQDPIRDDGNALQVVGSRSLLSGTNQRIEDFIGNRFGSKPADGTMGKNRIECRFALHHDGAFKLGWQTVLPKTFQTALAAFSNA